jgi:hypothetical protein
LHDGADPLKAPLPSAQRERPLRPGHHNRACDGRAGAEFGRWASEQLSLLARLQFVHGSI